MPPVQSQASCVGARAIVWIAETLLLATEGFVDAPSSFVEGFVDAPSSFVKGFVDAPSSFVQFRRRVVDAVQFRPVSSSFV